MDPPPNQPPLAVSRPQSAQDLESQKEKTTDFYQLEDPMDIVEEELFEPFVVDEPLNHAPFAESQQIFPRPQLTQDWQNQSKGITDVYELKETMEIVEEEPFATFAVNVPLDQASFTESHQTFRHPQSTQDWGNQNKRITDLYELMDTMEMMEEELFEPSAVDAPLYQAPFAESQHIFPRPQSTQDWENRIAQFSGFYEFNELMTSAEIVEEQAFGTFAIDPPLVQVSHAVPRQSFYRPSSAQDWEYQQPKITDRYESNELNDFSKIAEEELLASFAMNPPRYQAPLMVCQTQQIIHHSQSAQGWNDQMEKITNI